MEYFNKKLYDLRSECNKYIVSEMQKLADENGNYELVDPKAVEDLEMDVLMDCPMTSNEGRHSIIYHYYIYKVEITGDLELWFHGVEPEDANDYVFSYNELDTECLVDVASRFQSLDKETNG